MPKQWKVKSFETKDLPNLPQYPALILRLLALRGITDEEAIRDFLEPDYGKLLDPFLFRDMQKTVERIQAAIANKEKIAVYADYDADAITACSVMYLTLQKLGAQASVYIPDRFTEGYGMNTDAVKKLAEEQTKLIITVDCGMNAVEEAKLCRELGVDLIITDHHELTGELPEALVVINPKNPHDNYPAQVLTGVGVAFKVVQALFEKVKSKKLEVKIADGFEKWLLDLVAIGTVADLQSLSGENRILVSFGLKVLAKTKWLGLRALLEATGLDNLKYDTFTLGFIIAPRINAAGRIKHADAAFKLLISQDPTEAQKLALELNELNKHRQMLTEQVLSEAKAQAELIADKKVLVVHGVEWPKGVVGLVAGRLTEEYNRPVLAISVDSEGVATGSARSVAEFDIVQALSYSQEFLQRFGGHAQAAGFTLHRDHLEALHSKLLEYAESMNLEISEKVVKADAEVAGSDISWEVLELVEKLAPFGIGNPKPKFMGQGLEVLEYRGVGNTNQHLKLKVKFGTHTLGAIAFNQGFWLQQITMGTRFDAVFELSVNEWNGNKAMELKIIDMKLYGQ